MITAIFDTNVVVQSLIGSPRSASRRAVAACFDGSFRLAYTWDTVNELLDVLVLPRIRKEHALTDVEILDFVESLLADGDRFPDVTIVSTDEVRDVTDRKFVSLAVESRADFLVTNDRRHILPLKQIRETQIVTPTAFLRALSLER